MKLEHIFMLSNLLSDSGKELVIDELVEVMVVIDWLLGCFPYWTTGLPNSTNQMRNKSVSNQTINVLIDSLPQELLKKINKHQHFKIQQSHSRSC